MVRLNHKSFLSEGNDQVTSDTEYNKMTKKYEFISSPFNKNIYCGYALEQLTKIVPFSIFGMCCGCEYEPWHEISIRAVCVNNNNQISFLSDQSHH